MPAKRGRSFPAAAWWVKAVQERIKKEMVENGGRGLPDLGRRLAERAHRTKPFDHGFLTNVRDGRQAITLELMEAVCEEFELPPPVIYPRSHREAILMLAVRSAFDEPGKEPEISAEDAAERARQVVTHGIRRNGRAR